MGNRMIRARGGAVVLSAAALSGCMGSDPAPVAQPTFAERAVAAANSATRIDAIPNTAYNRMPAAGTASYQGAAALGMTSAAGEDYALLGQADIAVDFATASLTGALSQFEGGVIAPNTVLPGTVSDYTGTISITGGQIGVTRPNDFSATFVGTLVGAGNSIVTSGTLSGDFKGTPIRAIAGTSTSDQTTINGSTTSVVSLDFWAE